MYLDSYIFVDYQKCTKTIHVFVMEIGGEVGYWQMLSPMEVSTLTKEFLYIQVGLCKGYEQ